MRLLRTLREIAHPHEPMARHTSFRVGGPVRYYFEPRSWEELDRVHAWCGDAGLPVRTLGRGCNTLVTDGPHDWAVVSTQALSWLNQDGNRLDVGAGYNLGRLVSEAARRGLEGFEGLAGIPGTLGGAVAMNAGGRHGAIADRLASAVIAFPGQRPHEVGAGRLGLAYRQSNVRGGLPLVLSASFHLGRASSSALRARRDEILAEKRASQPMRSWSAGCVFKNPPGDSAGRLIDACGLKGAREGGALVSRKHANFIVNRGDATASDILCLIDRVSQRVEDEHGVRLELEIEVWGDAERSCHGRA